MIDFSVLMKEAESELLDSSALKKSVQIAILYSTIRQAVQVYTKSSSPELTSISMHLLQNLLTSGAVHEVLYADHSQPEIKSTEPTQIYRHDSQEPKKPLTPESNKALTEDEIRRFAKGMNMTDEEAELLVRSSPLMTVSGEDAVIARTDEDLARQEAKEADSLTDIAGFSEPPPDYIYKENLSGVMS